MVILPQVHGKCHTDKIQFSMPAVMRVDQCEWSEARRLRCLLSTIMVSMQAMTFWEVLWAEDYYSQMNHWTPASSTGEIAHIMVSIVLCEGAPLKTE